MVVTNTTKALQYVNDVILTEENGNEKELESRVVVVITDGREQNTESLAQVSNKLQENVQAVSFVDFKEILLEIGLIEEMRTT